MGKRSKIIHRITVLFNPSAVNKLKHLDLFCYPRPTHLILSGDLFIRLNGNELSLPLLEKSKKFYFTVATGLECPLENNLLMGEIEP